MARRAHVFSLFCILCVNIPGHDCCGRLFIPKLIKSKIKIVSLLPKPTFHCRDGSVVVHILKLDKQRGQA